MMLAITKCFSRHVDDNDHKDDDDDYDAIRVTLKCLQKARAGAAENSYAPEPLR